MSAVLKTNVKERVSEAEWQARVELAATYRLVALNGWDDLIFTHLSLCVPGEDNHFLLNPFGMMFEEITASSLVKVDLDGNLVDPGDYGINPAGFTIHSAVHGAGAENHAVLHTHSDNGVAVAAQKEGLLPISQFALTILADVAYHDYEGIALNLDERERLIADLGDKSSLILRNHGLLTVGATCADAFLRLYTLERACSAQVRAQAGGALNPVSEEAVSTVLAQAGNSGGLGSLAWPALIRKLDRLDPGYTM